MAAEEPRPAQKKAEQSAALAERLKIRAVEAALASAAAEHGVKKGLLGRFPRLYSDQLGYDEETGTVLLRGEGNTPVYNTQGQPKTARDLVAELKSDPSNADLFESSVQQGAGAQPASQRTGGKPVYRTKAEYLANLGAIAKGDAIYDPGE